MKETSTRNRIQALIIQWFEQFSNGDRFTTDDCTKYVNRYIPKKQETGTIKREMRYLRSWEKINYIRIGECREKIIQIIK